MSKGGTLSEEHFSFSHSNQMTLWQMPTQTLVENSSPRFCVFRNNDKVRRLGYQLEQYLWNVRETFGFTADWPVGLCGAARALRQADVLVDFCWLQVIFGYFSMMFSKKKPPFFMTFHDFTPPISWGRFFQLSEQVQVMEGPHFEPPRKRGTSEFEMKLWWHVFFWKVFPVFLFSSCTF